MASSRPTPGPCIRGASLGGNASLAFCDRLHGWLLFDYATSSAFSSAGMIATSDGGKTWHQTRSVPGFYGEIQAYLNGDIWASGGAGGGIELAVSHDRAATFHDVRLPAPREIAPADEPTYGLPIFSDRINGYEAVNYSGGPGVKSAEVLFVTADRGKTWRPDRILSNLAESSRGGKVTTAIAGSQWMHSLRGGTTEPLLIKVAPTRREQPRLMKAWAISIGAI